MFRALFISILITLWGATAMAQTVEDILQADRDFNQMAQEGEVREAFLAYAASDAIMMNPGQHFIEGDGATHAFISNWPDGVRLSWQPIGGMMAESGELGFTYGTYLSLSSDEEGNETASHGKYVTIWQRQEDGSWKWALDGGNPSPAPEE